LYICGKYFHFTSAVLMENPATIVNSKWSPNFYTCHQNYFTWNFMNLTTFRWRMPQKY